MGDVKLETRSEKTAEYDQELQTIYLGTQTLQGELQSKD